MNSARRVRATLFADDPSDDHTDYQLIEDWLKKWQEEVRLENYSTGGWEHVWDVEAPLEILVEIPRRFFLASKWATYPSILGGNDDPHWQQHFDDGKGD